MHRPPARRPRPILSDRTRRPVASAPLVLATALVVALGACADDGPAGQSDPASTVRVVAVTAQRCERPNRIHGVGVVVDDGLVLTAGHTVEGDLRDLEVDGRPASLVSLDRNSDLAVLSADGVVAPREVELAGSGTTAAPYDALDDELTLVRPDGNSTVHVARRVTLIVDHVSDHATYRRDVVVFTPGVVPGDSGAPLVDDAGRVVGIVILDRDDTVSGEGYAVTADGVRAAFGPTFPTDELLSNDQAKSCP